MESGTEMGPTTGEAGVMVAAIAMMESGVPVVLDSVIGAIEEVVMVAHLLPYVAWATMMVASFIEVNE